MSSEHPTMKPINQVGKVRVRVLDFDVVKTAVTEFKLEDGSTLRVTPKLNDVNVVLDENGNVKLAENGLPTYNFQIGFDIRILPKSREAFISTPPEQKPVPKGITS
ncbi:MAG: hypothetical protein QG670_1429 [Thermoproteota archaeon]|nr:hypothetical protein [Thermoproteota archaeon]